jgi:hypothetical protein
MANEVIDVREKLAKAEQRFENLHDLNAANIIFTGKHTAASEKHPTVLYDFGRSVKTADADYLAGYAPELDLTTLNGNGGVGKRAWGSSGGTAAPTPVKDLIKMVKTANRRRGVSVVVMAEDAYELFEADINANYADAADLTIAVAMRVERIILPMVDEFQGLNYRRSFPVGMGRSVDIYTYDAVYHTRDTGAETAYVPAGYVACIPPKQYGVTVYGRIMHPRAKYSAMPRWINFWENPKSGKKEWETHMNYIMAPLDVDSIVCWKVK